MAFVQTLLPSSIIDLTEDDEMVDADDVQSACAKSTTRSAIGGSDSLKRPEIQETLDLAVSRAETAGLLLSSRLNSWKDLTKPTTHNNNAAANETPFADKTLRSTSNECERPVKIEGPLTPRLLPYRSPKSTSLPRVGSSRPQPGLASSANAHQRAKDTVWDFPDSDVDDNRSRSAEQRRDTPTTTPEETTLASDRIPRKAASSANRAIADSYKILNPLETQLEARVTTPRKPGRPRKDEWTPTKQSGSGRDRGKSEIGGRYIGGGPMSPTPQSKVQPITAVKDGTILAGARAIDILSKKRKRSSISGDASAPQKEPGTPLPQVMHSENIATPVQQNREFLSAANQHAQITLSPIDERASNMPKDSSCMPRQPPVVPPSFFPTVITPVIDKMSQSSTAPVVSAAQIKVYETIIHPTIAKATKPHNGILPDDELTSIGRKTAIDIMNQDLTPYVLGSLSHDQKKQLKRLVKKTFEQKVKESSLPAIASAGASGTAPCSQTNDLGQSNANSIQEISPNDNRVQEASTSGLRVAKESQGDTITDLPGYLKTLEDQTHESDFELFDEPTNLPNGPLNVPHETISLPRAACHDCRERHRRCTHHEIGNKHPTKVRLFAAPELDSHRLDMQAKATLSAKEAVGLDDSQRHHSLQSASNTQSPFIGNTLPVNPNRLDPSFVSDEPFPAGFDRGRYPAQRRRRGNKFYTPERPPTISTVFLTEAELRGDRTTRQAMGKSGVTNKHSVRDNSAFRPSNNILDPTPSHSQDLLKQESAKRLNSDQALKELTQAVASGKATPSQLEAFRKYVADVDAIVHQQAMPSVFMNQDIVMEDELHESQSATGFSFDGESSRNERHWRTSQRDGLKILRTWASRYGNAGLPQGQSVYPSSLVTPEERKVSPVPRTLATASDHGLERLVAVFITNDSATPRPYNKEVRYSITSEDQERLVEDPDFVKHVNVTGSKLVRIETKVVDPTYRPQRSISSLLRYRELGSGGRGRNIDELRLRNAETIETWRYWKGASGDIVAAAWAPDSTTYAVGAAAHTNAEDLQYNRPCNLLLGELTSNILTELPDHRVDRPKPETISTGPNASQAVYDACDPNVYQTVTSIAFAPSGNRMYTASHDRTVKIWDIPQKRCLATLQHNAWVTSIEVCTRRAGLFATASKSIQDSIHIYYSQTSDDSLCRTQFSSSRALMRPLRQIYPECLRWGPTPQTSHLLLAGFQQWSDDGEDGLGEGQLLLWDANAFKTIKVSPSSQSVYAAAWHPTQPFFATGGAPGNNVTDKWTTKSVVRTWDVRTSKHYTMEYECSAMDMQDITFSPSDSNIVTAGCTDGTSFVWDFRRPDQPLHRLRHGRPIVGWDHGEEVDTGVMMSLWGLGGTLFYTGSSDGKVKAWDIRRHPQDVLVRNVAQFGAGIQSGAFSPDGTNLLVGDADGGVHILSSAPCGPRTKLYDRGSHCKEEPIPLVRAPDGSGLRLNQDNDNPGTEGREAADELIRSGRLEYHPDLGVGKGPNYSGPYAIHHRKEPKALNKRGPLKPEHDKDQPFSRHGERRDEIVDGRRAWLEARKQTILPERNKSKLQDDKETAHVIGRLREQLMQRAASEASTSRSSSIARPPNVSGTPSGSQPSRLFRPGSGVRQSTSSKASDLDSTYCYSDTDVTESEMVEENFWWDRLGEDEIKMAREGKRPVDQELY